MKRVRTLLLAGGLSLVAGAGVEYTVKSAAAVRTGCTPRCRSTAEDGAWRCDDVVSPITGKAATVCNTFQLKGDHTCHFHYMDQQEVGSCLGGQSADVLFLGGGHASGLSWTMYPWFDPNTEGDAVFDNYAWMAQANVNGVYDVKNGGIEVPYPLLENRIPEWNLMLASHIMLSDEGKVLFKTAQTQHSQYEIYDVMLSNIPQEAAGQWSMTHMNTKSFDRANQALDAIKKADRQNRKTYVFVNLGSWDYYAFRNCDFACPFMGTDADALRKLSLDDKSDKGVTAFLSYIRSKLVAFVERCQKEFPNYVLFLSDTPGVPYADAAGLGLSQLTREVAGQYPNAHFLAMYDMANIAENHSSLVKGHGVGIFNQNVFQRMMSVACNQDNVSGAECEEEIVGETTCQFDTIAPTNFWWEHWYRPCHFTQYMRENDGSMSSPATSTPSSTRRTTTPTVPTTPTTPSTTPVEWSKLTAKNTEVFPSTPPVPPEPPTTLPTPPTTGTPSTLSTTPVEWSKLTAKSSEVVPSTPPVPPTTPSTLATTPTEHEPLAPFSVLTAENVLYAGTQPPATEEEPGMAAEEVTNAAADNGGGGGDDDSNGGSGNGEASALGSNGADDGDSGSQASATNTIIIATVTAVGVAVVVLALGGVAHYKKRTNSNNNNNNNNKTRAGSRKESRCRAVSLSEAGGTKAAAASADATISPLHMVPSAPY